MSEYSFDEDEYQIVLKAIESAIEVLQSTIHDYEQGKGTPVGVLLGDCYTRSSDSIDKLYDAINLLTEGE